MQARLVLILGVAHGEDKHLQVRNVCARAYSAVHECDGLEQSVSQKGRLWTDGFADRCPGEAQRRGTAPAARLVRHRHEQVVMQVVTDRKVDYHLDPMLT